MILTEMEGLQREIDLRSTLEELNDINGASFYTYKYAKEIMGRFGDKGIVNGVLMGTAYGGGIERIANVWGQNGKVYGFDTFEDTHPTHLAEGNSEESACMDYWYNTKGTDKLSLAYQTQMFKDMGLDNVTLIKGEVNKDSCKDIDNIHYAFLDMDILASMKAGYEAVKDKIVPGGLLLMHDVTGNLPRVYDWFWEDVVLKDNALWRVEAFFPKELLAVLKRK